jgi:hypothetical protein
MKFIKFFSSDAEASSKRLIAIVLTAVYISIVYIVVFKKVAIANQSLASDVIWYLVLLILIFGGFIAAESLFSFLKGKAQINADAGVAKAKEGIPDNVVIQSVEKQEVNSESGKTGVENG